MMDKKIESKNSLNSLNESSNSSKKISDNSSKNFHKKKGSLEKSSEKSQENKKSSKKSSSKNTIIFASIFILVVALFVGGYFLFNTNHVDQRDYSIYNGFAFEQNGQYWQTSLERNGNLFDAPFNIHPLDLEKLNYSFNETVLDLILRVPHTEFILAIRPDAGSVPVQAGVNIARITGKFYGIPTSSALYIPADERGNQTFSAPVVDCSNATSLVPIIWLSVSQDTPGISLDKQNHNCIIVGSNGLADRPDGLPKDIINLGDLLVYKMLGVMK